MHLSEKIESTQSRITEHLSMVFVGNMTAAAIGFISIVVISRQLEVSDFGLFSTAMSIIIVASRLCGLGTPTAMVTFASRYFRDEKPEVAAEFMRATFIIRIIASAIVGIIFIVVARPISTEIFHNERLIPLIRLSALGIVFYSMVRYFKSVFITCRLYRASVILQLAIDIYKLLAVLLLVSLIGGGSFNALLAFVSAPALMIIYSYLRLRDRIFMKRSSGRNIYATIASYSKWIFITNISSLMMMHVGVFMLFRMIDNRAAGIYGLTLNLTYAFPILIFSLGSVLLPEVARFKEVSQIEEYLKKMLKVSICVGILFIPLLFLSDTIIPFVFGEKYADAVPVFNWLLFAYIFMTVNCLIRVAIYAINRPGVIAVMDTIKLIIFVMGAYLFIPSVGVTAPAVVMLIVNFLSMIAMLVYIFRKLRSGDIEIKTEDMGSVEFN